MQKGPTVAFVRSQSILLDGRMQKYVGSFQRLGVEPIILSWARDGDDVSVPNAQTKVFRAKSKAGGKWRGGLAYARWWAFIFYELTKSRSNIDAVHAADFDSIVPSFLFSRIFGKKIIYDIYDHFSDSRGINGPVGKVISGLERVFAKKSDLTIFADEKRLTQHGVTCSPNFLIVENVPVPLDLLVGVDAAPVERLKLGYFGILERTHRGLENLITLANQNEDIELNIVGIGALADEIKAAARGNPRISFFGGKPHAEGMKLMAQNDIIMGLYYLSNKNHLYAAPNKYYEHLMLGKPLLTSAGTIPGDKVELHQTGWSIGDSPRDLAQWLRAVTPSAIRRRELAARELWQSQFQGYSARIIDGEYRSRVTRWFAVGRKL